MTLMSGYPSGIYERDQELKQYYKVLLVGGRIAQSSEINEIQQIQDNQRARLTTSIYPEGSIISGGYASQDPETNTISLKETKILLKEYIFILPSSTIVPNLEGDSTIGILLTRNFIGPEIDRELLSPVEGTTSFGSKGAYRIQYITKWVAEPDGESIKENEYYYPLYSTSDGKVIVTQSRTSSEIYDTIARYDNDANGSYITDGMSMYYSHDEGDYHICGVSEGVAHVNGYEVVFSFTKPVNIPRALDEFSRVSEPVSVSGSGVYKTRHSPVSRVSRVLITKQRTLMSFTHGNYSGARDSLIKTNTTGTVNLNSTDSEANKDRVLAITKIVGIFSDPEGTNRYVIGRDYHVDGDSIDWSPAGEEPSPGSTYYVTLQYLTTDVEYSITDDLSGVVITDDSIASGEWCAIDYTHYMQRIDTVVLYSDGSISVIKGSPSEDNPSPQNISGGLVLSTVLVRYGHEPYFYKDYYKAVKMSELLEIKRAISTLQNNLAQLDLKTDISAKDPATTRSGMFVDPFYDDDQRDQGLEQTAEIVENTLYPYRQWTIFSIHTGNDITLPYSETTMINQKYRTKSRQINEFLTMGNKNVGKVSISPSVYRWAYKFTSVSNSQWKRYGVHKYGSAQDSSISQIVSTNEVFSVPQFPVSVIGSNFQPEESVTISISGVSVKTLAVDEEGKFSTTVETPATMKSGAKQVEVIGNVSGIRAITTLSTVPQSSTRYITTYYENNPIGQTFLNEELHFMSSLSLYFSSLPSSRVRVCICETSSGYPDPTKIIAEKSLEPEEIITTNWTKFVFNSPVLLMANTYYSFIVISEESTGMIYTAELGKRDTWNNAWMTQNVLSSGTLVQASQLLTWSAIQSEDVTFSMNQCKFVTGSRTFDLGTATVVSGSPVSQLYLMADSEVFSDTNVEYKAELDGDSGTYFISEYSPLQLSSEYVGNIKLSATLSSSSENGILSPRINGDIQLAGCIPVYPSEYITRAFPSDGRYMKLYLDTHEIGTQVFLKYQNTETGIWYDLDIDNIKYPPTNIGDGWATRIFYKDLGDFGAGKGYIRIKIIFDNSGSSTVSIPSCRNLRVLTTNVEV